MVPAATARFRLSVVPRWEIVIRSSHSANGSYLLLRFGQVWAGLAIGLIAQVVLPLFLGQVPGQTGASFIDKISRAPEPQVNGRSACASGRQVLPVRTEIDSIHSSRV